jgi:LPS sulfotransferase NodH
MDARIRQASPLIVIGMHRSGTRLLVDILQRLGVFMGDDLQADAESVTFMLINEGVLHQCGAFWSEPMAAHFVLAQPDFLDHLAASVAETLSSQLPNYVGQSGWRPGKTSEQTPPFGWKDPRNTFTLPVWRQVFPNARTIHIMRHGVDVAASLSRRHAKALRAATGETVPSALTVIQDHAFGVLSSRRGWTLAEALTMWEQYVEKARVESAELGERALEVRFEDLLLQPDEVISAIAKFCGVPMPTQPEAMLDSLKESRAFAFRRDPELVAFAETVRDNLGRYGYVP